ncbi:uncharacterized protein LOC108101564 [Drosophila ficusphila]|uniref:uncharacterized protein LOC108101564 n=1 Tax=Drosophila ficusphila TaxID=30025 RepID=UPI0007E71B48|nr:uncharacterized protein LOC108101564 [Drosophila ficusphila]
MKLRSTSEMKPTDEKKSPPKILSRRVNAENFPARRIPNNALKRTLEIATSSVDGFWLNKNTSCAPPVSYELYSGVKRSITSQKLRLARSCLMQRDYKNLAKILASNHSGDSMLKKVSFTVFMEYAGIVQKCPKPKTKPDIEPIPPESAMSEAEI